MTLIELENFDDDRSTYLKSIVEQTQEFEKMANYFKQLGGNINEADFTARYIKGQPSEGISVIYQSTTSGQDELELTFDIDTKDNEIDSIIGRLTVKSGDFT